jgi:histidyl-tRNA synthetase
MIEYAAIEAGLAQRDQVAKLYYLGPMFRRERPQKGRTRQFHQLGAEVIGRDDPLADAEVIMLIVDCLRAAGLEATELILNSLGDETCRPAYRAALTAYGRAHIDELCANCRQRLERNPLRLLDCKEEGCRRVMADAPLMRDHLCDPCRTHFAEVERLLVAADVPFRVEPRLVRGLDYYVRTAFEVVAETSARRTRSAGRALTTGRRARRPAASGHRLRDRSRALAHGDRRLGVPGGLASRSTSSRSTDATPAAVKLTRRLRDLGMRCELEAAGRSVKSAMRRADKLAAHFAVLIGEDELRAGRATVRDLRSQADHRLALAVDDSGPALAATLRTLAGTRGDDRG